MKKGYNSLPANIIDTPDEASYVQTVLDRF